jgi:hypothetical protein
VAGVLVAAAALFYAAAQPQVSGWGSTEGERSAAWPGDELIADPAFVVGAASDGGGGLVVLHALARRRVPPVPALGFAAADAGGAMVAAGVLARRRRVAVGNTVASREQGRGPPA